MSTQTAPEIIVNMNSVYRRSIKLDLDKAREIRRRRKDGESWKDLAAAFSVSRTMIRHVVNGTCWPEA